MQAETTATGGMAGTDAPPPLHPRHSRRLLVLTALALALLVVVLAAVKGAQIGKAIAAGKKAQAAGPPPEAVSTVVASAESWDETLRSVGSVTTARGVSISNDAPGIVWQIHFESGATVAAGDVLVELDTRVERSQLASARARERLASSNLARTRSLVESGAIGSAQLDTDSAQLDGAKADADALAQQIERKIVRAPFAGKLGIRLVNVGQYLAPGTPITELESADGTYVDFDLPQQDLARLSVGMPVRIEMEATDGGVAGQPSDGAIAAVAPEVDPTTRNIRVRASVPPKDARLRPGMFVDVEVVLPQKASVVAVPQTAVVYASYGDSIFVVEAPGQAGGAKVARQQFVKLGPSRGDFVAVADGVTAGQEVVTGGAFKLRNGTRVSVNDAVEPRPELQPHPPNR